MKLVAQDKMKHPGVTVEDVNRLLEVGRLLLSVLTPDELEELQALLCDESLHHLLYDSVKPQIGNSGVT